VSEGADVRTPHFGIDDRLDPDPVILK